MKGDNVWEEKYSSDALTRITVWMYNQKNKEWQRPLHAQLSSLVFCLIVLVVKSCVICWVS